MDKQVFLSQLRSSLMGRISPEEMESHIAYYDNYISAGVRQGKTEEEVLRELNNPSLIAKSIISASDARTEGNGRDTLAEDMGGEPQQMKSLWPVKAQIWLRVILVVLVIILIIAVIVKLFVAAIPILIPIAIILYVKKHFFDRN